MKIHRRICNLCEATCGLLVEVEQGTITSIRGDAEDPFSHGHICPKAHALKDVYEDPDRLKMPLLRSGDSWCEVSWQEAVAAATSGLHAVQERYGRDSVGIYVGNPTVHNLPATLGVPALIRALGTRNRFSASSVDQFPRMLASYLVYGAQLAVPIADLDRTDYLLVLGANPVVSNGSLMTAPGVKRRLRAIRKRGGKIVVIDPRRTETAELADEHIALRPGTDALLLLALLEAIVSEGLLRLGAAEGLVDGLDHIAKAVLRFPAERVSEATAVPAEKIRRLAREFAAAPSAACYGRVGTCLQRFGTLANYLIDVLNISTGRLDSPGGVMFPTPAAPVASRGHYGRWRSRVRGLVEFGGELPAATLAEEIETAGEGRIRAMVTLAGNPVLSTPNGTRLDRALASLKFMVSIDPQLNETTRHANVILPPRHSLENHQYSLVFHQVAVRNTAKFTEPVFRPAQDSWSEWEILASFCEQLAQARRQETSVAGKEPDPCERAAEQFALSPTEIVAGLLAMGPYGITLEQLLKHPEGIDLGPLQEGGIARAVQHSDGRIRLEHEEIDRELAALEREVNVIGKSTDHGLLLIGRRQLRSNNSWMHNCPSLMKGRDRCTLLMHPDDAAERSLSDGAEVSVRSRTGEVSVCLEIDERMMPGVVSLPHGFGHTRPGVRLSLASARAGVSINDLTDDQVTEGLVGNGVLSGVPVQVRAAEQSQTVPRISESA